MYKITMLDSKKSNTIYNKIFNTIANKYTTTESEEMTAEGYTIYINNLTDGDIKCIEQLKGIVIDKINT